MSNKKNNQKSLEIEIKNSQKKVIMIRDEHPENFRAKLELHLNDESLEIMGMPCAVKHQFVAYFMTRE
tara:strand:- start:534 stop:737 length:204 start_codon:yes stop_codon:yes gene_type:complete